MDASKDIAAQLFESKLNNKSVQSISQIMASHQKKRAFYRVVTPDFMIDRTHTDLTTGGDAPKTAVVEIEIQTIQFEGLPRQMVTVRDISQILQHEKLKLKSDF